MSCRKCPAQFPAMQEKGYCSPLGELDLQHRGVATAAVADQPKRFSVEVDPIRPQLLVAGWAADRRHPNDADAGEQEAEFSIAVAHGVLHCVAKKTAPAHEAARFRKSGMSGTTHLQMAPDTQTGLPRSSLDMPWRIGPFVGGGAATTNSAIPTPRVRCAVPSIHLQPWQPTAMPDARLRVGESSSDLDNVSNCAAAEAAYLDCVFGQNRVAGLIPRE